MSAPKELNTLLKEIRGLDTKIAKLEEEQETLNAERTEKLKRTQQLIQSGVTTGNTIRDYIMARYGGVISPSRERAYRVVNKALAGKKGELVAIITYEDRRTYGPHDRTETIKCIYVGVLRDDKLRFTLGTKPSCSLPIDSYAKLVDTLGERKLEIVKKPFQEHYTGVFEVLKASEARHERPSDKYHMAVVAGTKKVRALGKYQLLSLLPKDRKILKQAEQDLGLLELQA